MMTRGQRLTLEKGKEVILRASRDEETVVHRILQISGQYGVLMHQK